MNLISENFCSVYKATTCKNFILLYLYYKELFKRNRRSEVGVVSMSKQIFVEHINSAIYCISKLSFNLCNRTTSSDGGISVAVSGQVSDFSVYIIP